MRGVGLGDDQQAGGVLVEPVDDARPPDPADARRLSPQWAISALTSVPSAWPGGGMDDEPGRLVDHDQMLVLEDDVERQVLGRRAANSLGRRRLRTRSARPAARRMAGSRATAPSTRDLARPRSAP